MASLRRRLPPLSFDTHYNSQLHLVMKNLEPWEVNHIHRSFRPLLHALVFARAMDASSVGRITDTMISVPRPVQVIPFLEKFAEFGEIIGMSENKMLTRFPIGPNIDFESAENERIKLQVKLHSLKFYLTRKMLKQYPAYEDVFPEGTWLKYMDVKQTLRAAKHNLMLKRTAYHR